MNESTQTNPHSKATLLYINDQNDDNTISVLKTNTQKLIILNPTQSFEEYEQIKERIDLIVADISSVNDLTFNFIKKIRTLNDWETPILLISDLKDNTLLSEIIRFKIDNFILKPFQEGTFLKIIHESISKIEKIKIIEQQREQLEQFQLILDKLNLVSETNLKGEITYVNQRFCDVSGFTKEELIGQTHKLLRHNDTSSEIYQKMWENLHNGKMWLGKLKNNNKNKEPYYIKLIIVPIKNAQGICQVLF